MWPDESCTHKKHSNIARSIPGLFAELRASFLLSPVLVHACAVEHVVDLLIDDKTGVKIGALNAQMAIFTCHERWPNRRLNRRSVGVQSVYGGPKSPLYGWVHKRMDGAHAGFRPTS